MILTKLKSVRVLSCFGLSQLIVASGLQLEGQEQYFFDNRRLFILCADAHKVFFILAKSQ